MRPRQPSRRRRASAPATNGLVWVPKRNQAKSAGIVAISQHGGFLGCDESVRNRAGPGAHAPGADVIMLTATNGATTMRTTLSRTGGKVLLSLRYGSTGWPEHLDRWRASRTGIDHATLCGHPAKPRGSGAASGPPKRPRHRSEGQLPRYRPDARAIAVSCGNMRVKPLSPAPGHTPSHESSGPATFR